MGISDWMAEVRADPYFRKQDYRKQQELWAEVLANRLAKMPDFQKLSPATKQQVFRESLVIPPTLDDPQAEQEAVAVVQQAQSGNEQAVRQMQDRAALGNLAKQFTLAQLFEKYIQYPLLKGYTEYIASPIHQLFGGKSYTYEDIFGKRHLNKDLHKITDYYNLFLDNAYKEEWYNSAARHAMTFVGAAADIGAMYATGVGTLAKPRGLVKLAMKGYTPIMRRAPLLLFKAGRAGIHAAGGGFVGLVRENTKDYFTEMEGNPDWRMMWRNSGKYFSEYALGDLAVFAVGGFVKHAATPVVKNFVGWERRVRKVPLSDKEWKRALLKAWTGDIDPALWARMGPENQLRMEQLRAFGTVVNHVEQATPEELFKALAGMRGYVAQVDDAGRWMLQHTDDTVKSGWKSFDDIQTWLDDQLGPLPEEQILGTDKIKVEARYGPKGTLIDLEAKDVYVDPQTEVASGTFKQVMKMLDDYVDPIPVQKVGRVKANQIAREFTVDIPEWGERRTFKTLYGAKNYLRHVNDWDNALYMANKKGLRVDRFRGRWALYGEGNKYVVDTLDDVQKIIADTPMPEWAPELTGFDEQLVAQMNNKIPDFQFKPSTYNVRTKADGNLGAKWIMSKYIKGPEALFLNANKQGALPDELLDMFYKLENSRDLTNIEMAKFMDLGDNAFRKANGHMMSMKEQDAVGILMQTPENKWDDLVREFADRKHFTFTDDHYRAARRLREVYGETRESGLAAYFQLEPEKFIDDYLPRIRDYVADPKNPIPPDMEVKEFLQRVWGGQAPPSPVLAFFKHGRVSEVAQYALERSPLIQLKKYLMAGHKEMTLGPVVDEIKDFLNANWDRIDPHVAAHYASYLNDVMGIPYGIAQKDMRAVVTKLHQHFMKGKSRAVVNSAVEMILGSSYSSAMGLRAWLPIRNSQQVWTTLGPRIGDAYVADAIQEVVTSKGLFEKLRGKGLFQPDIPVMGREHIGSSLVGKVTRGTLIPYRSSDDYTRAVAYVASRRRLQHAMQFLPDTDKFLKEAKLNVLPEPIRNQVFDALANKKNFELAADIAGRQWINETMFPYRAGMMPAWYKGTLGKAFGMFGHYPVYYLQNMINGLTRGGLVDRAAYAAGLAANTAILYNVFDQVLGIRELSFLPWVPATFSGGPFYHLMNKAIMATNTRSYEGRQARSELGLGFSIKDGKPHYQFSPAAIWRTTRWVVPGGFAMTSWAKAFRAANEGDYVRFVGNLLSAPVRPRQLQ